MHLVKICLITTIINSVNCVCKLKNIAEQSLDETSMIDLNCHNHDVSRNSLEEYGKCVKNENESDGNNVNSDSGDSTAISSSSEKSSEESRNYQIARTTIKPSKPSYQEIRSIQDIEERDGPLTHHQYTVSIQRKGSHYATGALVGARWVITTAAEFYNVREHLKLFRLRFGSVDCKRRGITIPMKDVHSHPFFMPSRPDFDVSLIQTASKVPLSSSVKPVPLSTVTGKILQANFIVTYWPRIVIKDTILPPTAKERLKYKHMRVSTQKLISTKRCTELLKGLNFTLASSSYCLNPITEHHSVCMPDVGAPLVAKDGLWGVTSGWVPPHCISYPPTIFTRVASPSVGSWLGDMLNYTGLTD